MGAYCEKMGPDGPRFCHAERTHDSGTDGPKTKTDGPNDKNIWTGHPQSQIVDIPVQRDASSSDKRPVEVKHAYSSHANSGRPVEEIAVRRKDEAVHRRISLGLRWGIGRR